MFPIAPVTYPIRTKLAELGPAERISKAPNLLCGTNVALCVLPSEREKESATLCVSIVARLKLQAPDVIVSHVPLGI